MHQRFSKASSEISCKCTASKTLPYRTINLVFYLKGLLSGNSCQLLMIGKRPWVHACFLDMAKAFDKVNHDLLHKLRSVGVYSLELKWFSSYLHGRSISTVVEGVKSSRSCISSGVPQGSVLGPLLFLIYYRDLPSVTSSSTAMFADDTQLYDRCLNHIPTRGGGGAHCAPQVHFLKISGTP